MGCRAIGGPSLLCGLGSPCGHQARIWRSSVRVTGDSGAQDYREARGRNLWLKKCLSGSTRPSEKRRPPTTGVHSLAFRHPAGVRPERLLGHPRLKCTQRIPNGSGSQPYEGRPIAPSAPQRRQRGHGASQQRPCPSGREYGTVARQTGVGSALGGEPSQRRERRSESGAGGDARAVRHGLALVRGRQGHSLPGCPVCADPSSGGDRAYRRCRRSRRSRREHVDCRAACDAGVRSSSGRRRRAEEHDPGERPPASAFRLTAVSALPPMPLPSPLITRSPERLSGAAVFAGTRVPVQTLIDYLEDGESLATFLDDFPDVSREHAVAVLELARAALDAYAPAA